MFGTGSWQRWNQLLGLGSREGNGGQNRGQGQNIEDGNSQGGQRGGSRGGRVQGSQGQKRGGGRGANRTLQGQQGENREGSRGQGSNRDGGRGRGEGRGRGGRGRGEGGVRGRGEGGGRGRGEGGGRGRGEGGGRGRGGGRSWDDSGEYSMMQGSTDVKNFFRQPECHKGFLTGMQFCRIISLASQTEHDNKNVRHQFLIRLTQCPFLEMQGPIAGTILQLIQNPPDDGIPYLNGLKELLNILEEMVCRIPHCRNTQPYVTTILNLVDQITFVGNDIKSRVKKLQENLQDPTLVQARINDVSQNWSADVSFIAEPLLPDIDRLLNENLDACYTNPTKGGYLSPAHYLETWFRLMREDFLGPLRIAVKDFQTTFKPTDRLLRRVRLDGGYHYTVQKILRRDVIDGEFLYLVQYDQEELKHVNWNTTDRLRNDSMMVISDDHFQTARYATITDHDAKPSRKGQSVWLRMVGGPMDMEWFHGIEPMAFYEPTRCVLERLKVVAAKVHDGVDLPMSRYLVETRPDVKRPDYMTTRSNLKLPAGPRCASVVTTTSNPMISSLGLDFSQEDAMKLALTHELALIQGPPGTGKSYVGAMFVHIMMLNKDLWQKHDHGCMLLLAYKNHAIDQFIGECELMGMDMSRTVRIGSRSSAAMDKYLLRNRRKELQDRHEYWNLNVAIREKRKKLNEAQEWIKWIENVLRSKNSEMPFEAYSAFIPPNVYYQLSLLNDGTVVEETVIAWLVMRKVTPEMQLQLAIKQDQVPALENDVVEGYLQMYPNIYHMPDDVRCMMFGYWCEITRIEADRLLAEHRKWHQKVQDEMKALQRHQDIAAVRRADIIAMTTTGACKHGHLIDAVKPTIVVCEEAAEVLESHIVAPLTDGCQHIVLIGDHQQLRPSVSNFQLEKRNMSISLFERLIRNAVPSRRLQIQHRMHPEIADLLVPHIYASLEHHPSVTTYPEVKGVHQRMHFIHHEHAEEKTGEKSSCRNPYEADFLVSLCHYLLLQGYKPSQVTILVTYMGQMRLVKEKIKAYKQIHPDPVYTQREREELLKEEFKDYLETLDSIDHGLLKHHGMDIKTKQWFERKKQEYLEKYKKLDQVKSKMEDVRVTTVDNYQGEECTIILLSFVRSNAQCNIGFLKWANRICVALSRAKHGFYAIGDFKLFAKNQKSDLWKKLCTQLLSTYDERRLSSQLKIVCRKHNKIREIDAPEQFLKLAPLGGCLEHCDYRLPNCGHTCDQLCHPLDERHQLYTCKKKCQGSLSCCGHKCERRCDLSGDDRKFFAERNDQGNLIGFRQCLQCTKNIQCPVEIEVTPISCGHTGTTKCCKEATYKCMKLVMFSLDCGHSQSEPCSTQKETIKCRHLVTETLDCGHEIKRKCHNKQPKCKQVMMRKLDCGHEIQIQCHERFDLVTCEEDVDVELKCGHVRRVPCPLRLATLGENCNEPVLVKLLCGHKREFPCHASKKFLISFSTCEEIVEVKRPCQHTVNIECCDSRRELPRCTEKVSKKLPCGHNIDVKCSDADKTQTCKNMKQEVLKCSHLLQGPCYDFDNVKRRGCENTIQVSKPCGHKINVICREKDRDQQYEPCCQPCLLKCQHRKCGKRCGEACAVCTEPCKNQCKHSKCHRRCHEECDRQPCEEPCPKTLKCGHPCNGFCGELCPLGCPKCRSKKSKAVRRIRISPCNHDFTIKELDKHMKVRDSDRVQEVVVKLCPMKQCSTVIQHCPRYVNQITRYQQVLKLVRYEEDKKWWYCKDGHHYLDLPKHVDIAITTDHRCASYHHRVRENMAHALRDVGLGDVNNDVDRRAGLTNNPFMQRGRGGRGRGRGATGWAGAGRGAVPADPNQRPNLGQRTRGARNQRIHRPSLAQQYGVTTTSDRDDSEPESEIGFDTASEIGFETENEMTDSLAVDSDDGSGTWVNDLY